jgi:hypothetical protein
VLGARVVVLAGLAVALAVVSLQEVLPMWPLAVVAVALLVLVVVEEVRPAEPSEEHGSG